MTDYSGDDVIPLNPAAESELDAADWLAKLDRGDLSTEERTALMEWLAANPANKDALKKTASFWYGLNAPLSQLIGESQPPFGAASSHGESPQAGWFTGWLRPAAAASFAAILFIAAFVAHGVFSETEPATGYYATNVGEQRVVALDDGSEMRLNTNTIVEQEFTGEARVIRLVAGEAIFEVTHDADRPFIVYAADGVVRAVGTRFAVRVQPDRLRVTVTEGVVSMSRRIAQNAGTAPNPGGEEAKEVFVTAGEEAEIKRAAEAQKIPVAENDAEDRLSWAQGQLVFTNEKLDAVIAEVARYTTIEIRIDDPVLGEKRITGILPIGEVSQMLEGIEESLGVKADWRTPELVYLTTG